MTFSKILRLFDKLKFYRVYLDGPQTRLIGCWRWGDKDAFLVVSLSSKQVGTLPLLRVPLNAKMLKCFDLITDQDILTWDKHHLCTRGLKIDGVQEEETEINLTFLPTSENSISLDKKELLWLSHSMRADSFDTFFDGVYLDSGQGIVSTHHTMIVSQLALQEDSCFYDLSEKSSSAINTFLPSPVVIASTSFASNPKLSWNGDQRQISIQLPDGQTLWGIWTENPDIVYPNWRSFFSESSKYQVSLFVEEIKEAIKACSPLQQDRIPRLYLWADQDAFFAGTARIVTIPLTNANFIEWATFQFESPYRGEPFVCGYDPKQLLKILPPTKEPITLDIIDTQAPTILTNGVRKSLLMPLSTDAFFPVHPEIPQHLLPKEEII